MNIKLYADGANINDMLSVYKEGLVDGFTTNPSLMKKAGIKDYKEFAKNVVNEIPDLSISFEVFSDDFEIMEKEALIFKEFGENVFVKIPIQNSKGESSIPLIKKLSNEGVNLNITAIYTIEQVKETVEAVSENAKTYVSVFAGRLADAGIDPIPVIKESVEICHSKKNVELLWASTREVFNIFEAERLGVDIITVPDDIINKYKKVGKTPEQLSLDTVVTFANDIQELGYSIID
ncbi:transaldolase [Helcococcus sueciensis]|uniref:transaldolase n=1 Tax=Helcococcus sueciensis TaxID=241555 RepID=UPI00040B67EE|nr:transaldolase [Helcococcus sueciensis]